jgi:Protein of unknown function (DUF3485)
MPQAARRYLAPALLLALGASGSWFVRLHRPAPGPASIGLARLPLRLADFHGRELPTDKSVFAYLGADEMVDRLYIDDVTDRAVSLSVVFARGWRALHSPQHCFKNQGWRLISNATVDMPSGAPGGKPIDAGILVMDTARARIAVAYTFATQRATTASWTTHSFRMAIGQGQSGGALIVAVSPSSSAKEDGAAVNSASTILREAHRYLVANWKLKKE